jgi:hypothetical protein
MAGALAGLLAVGAQASVVYNWHSTGTGTGGLDVIGGHMVITDDAYRAGGFEAYENTDSAPPRFRYPHSPVLELSLQVTTNDGFYNPFDLTAYPRQGLYPNNPWLYELDLGINRTKDFLTGGFYFNTKAETDVDMGSNDEGLWYVYRFNSDAPSPCFDKPIGGPDSMNYGCTGALGEWKVNPETIPPSVPEPSVWSLFALSVLGLFSLVKLRRKA